MSGWEITKSILLLLAGLGCMMFGMQVLSDNLTKASGDEYEGTATLVLQRPVYKASYKTTLMSFQDKKIKFKYDDGDDLEYDENANLSDLTSLIAYYLNLFLGVEFDSFSPNGGSAYFAKCQNTVNLNSSGVGWNVAESGQNNRYWITENFTNSTYSKLHDFYYQYHRLGLDEMSGNVANGRARIAEGLPVLKEAYRSRPATYVINTFLDAKAEELVDIFKKGTDKEKKTVYDILMDIDATRQNTYDRINN